MSEKGTRPDKRSYSESVRRAAERPRKLRGQAYGIISYGLHRRLNSAPEPPRPAMSSASRMRLCLYHAFGGQCPHRQWFRPLRHKTQAQMVTAYVRTALGLISQTPSSETARNSGNSRTLKPPSAAATSTKNGNGRMPEPSCRIKVTRNSCNRRPRAIPDCAR